MTRNLCRRLVLLTACLLPAAAPAGWAAPELPPVSIAGLQLGMRLEDACRTLSRQVGPAPVQPARGNFTGLERLLEGTTLDGYADEGLGCEAPGHSVVILADVEQRVRLIEITPHGLAQLRKTQADRPPEDFPQAVTSLLPLTTDDFRDQGLRLGLTYRGGGWSMTLGNDYLLYYLRDDPARP